MSSNILNEPKEARRICSRCGLSSDIRPGESIWPAGHRCTSCGESAPSADGIDLFAQDLANTVSGFDPKSFDHLASIEDEHFWFVPRGKLLTSLLLKHFPNAQAFLEIGCGNGAVLNDISARTNDMQLFGSELHPAGLSVARRRLAKRAQFVQMDARKIMAENCFDVIGAFDVIEHIAEDEDVIRSAHRALRPKGGLIVSVPQHPWLWSSADEIAYHVRRYRRGEMEDRMRRNGFTIVFSASYCTFLLPLMIASRWLDRLKSRKTASSKPMVELEARPPALVNSAMRTILQLEAFLTLAGFHWPVGGSRIVIGVRD
jgi:SAM-dependent methyltransferase